MLYFPLNFTFARSATVFQIICVVCVAIMSNGPFFRQDRKSQEFRAWFDQHNGEKQELPAGAFKESGTGVATVLVTLDAA